MKPTRAMVLAAGLGTRMKPLSSLLPKPALPVVNRPLIVHCLEHLASHGVTFAVINTHHLADQLEQAVSRHLPEGLEVKFSRENAILGTAGGLKKAAREFRHDTFYLVNSDSLTDADLTSAAAAHAASGRAATMVVMPHEPGSGYRPVEVVGDDSRPTQRVSGIAGRRWGGGDLAPRTFIGIHLLEPSVLDSIPADAPCDINAEVYPRMLDKDPEAVGAWLHAGWWFEAGGPERYLDLNLQMLARSGRGAVVGPGFFIDEEAHVERSIIGARARLERKAVVEDCVIWDDVVVGEEVSLRRCIVTSGVTLPPLSPLTLERAIVMPGEDGGIRTEKM
jgi:NDP-sugar pyrophosphorylase family protein